MAAKDGELMLIAVCGPVSVRMFITATTWAVIVRVYPLFVPEHRHQAMCEAISIANWQLRLLGSKWTLGIARSISISLL